jgi:hypothetical protein
MYFFKKRKYGQPEIHILAGSVNSLYQWLSIITGKLDPEKPVKSCLCTTTPCTTCQKGGSNFFFTSDIWTQDLALAKHALYHLIHAPHLLCFSYFPDSISCFLSTPASNQDPPTSASL